MSIVSIVEDAEYDFYLELSHQHVQKAIENENGMRTARIHK